MSDVNHRGKSLVVVIFAYDVSMLCNFGRALLILMIC